MNLTLLPTDLKFTDKGTDKNPSALHDPVSGNHSSKFGQLLNAETASMQQKSATQVDSHHSREGKSAADKATANKTVDEKTVESGSAKSPDNAAIDGKTDGKLQAGAKSQDDKAEFTVLKDDELLSADALSAMIPIQIAGLVNSHANAAGSSVTTDDLTENELLAAELPDSEEAAIDVLSGKNAKDIRLTSADLAEQSNANELDEDTGSDSNSSAVLESGSGKEKLTANKAEYANALQANAISKSASLNKTSSSNASLAGSSLNSKELGQLQAAVQTPSGLTAATTDTASIHSPVIPAAAPLLSGGHQSVGQFQLNGTTSPLLSAHLGSEEWQQQLNQHVLFFNRNGLQQAELRLHPQELGALHIRMSVEDNQAQLHFVSAHQHVRTALEAALPGLRHALAENGIQLAQSSVNSDAQGNWQQDQHANNQTGSHADSRAGVPAPAAATGITAAPASAIRMTPQQLASTRGGVDTFA
ncbi:flagellar hook-length control protein FliK [Xenorhabdus mauleonii]|uniref:Flagellar hook-length control protein FliK n=1 Tax=Xenorhabdus mauleonii TaxID=351675 RepID=A0A1I3TBU3_9GAMM|nr:flagellar hook-length control protein FliK [Xenorhabdus mauleonii]PHM39338.1 flagellar hook-length control protein FliK [Xenorhabdus mauleonii]SFJ67201.1 flagellar hook-length control protein FliK [Xenorhabdus mauleonii]